MSPVPTSLLFLLLACPALLTLEAATPRSLEPRGQRSPRDTSSKEEQGSVKVVISEGCVTQGDPSGSEQGAKEVDLSAGSPLVLTHRITLVPSGSGAAASCGGGCEAQFAALRTRLERLEKEVSELREKCGGDGGCCSPQQSTGAGCTVRPEPPQCPNDCSDQGRCVNGKCVCFPEFSGADCSQSNCPGDCKDHGKCVDGKCVCDPGFSGPDCSEQTCPDNCKNRGRCVNGKCVCNAGFTGPDCSEQTCLNNCKNRGRCVNGKCVCDAGFTGPDCSEQPCLNNCKNRGRCVNGKCVCNAGFTGPDCSEQTCLNNCKNRGRCVNGKCVCDAGFTGPDCSEQTCLNNCKNRGRCVNGKCVCDAGYTGPDCSEQTCPDNCSGHGKCVGGKCVCDSGFVGPDCSDNTCSGNCRGRCVAGQCVCDPGFTGPDCTDKACPDNCSNRGKCVDGKCVCDVGFTGADCSAKGCPGNCNDKGRCVKGKCVCRRGFTGADCGQCEDGLTGPDCSIVMTGVSRLSSRDITETSATLFWTPPSVQYDTYHITFTSKKVGDQKITSQTEGRQSSYTQTGLAAGLEYTATIRGEKEGRMGAESSTEFMTLISGPKNLQVVKTTTTSAVVQWEQSQGEIDRYRLTVSPNDGKGKERDMTLPADRDSAQIDQLEAGRLYDITLVAEKGKGKSKPASTQATPGVTKPRVTTEALRRQGSRGGSVVDGASSSREGEPHSHTKEEEGGTGGLLRPDDRSTSPRRPGLVMGPSRFNRTRIRPTGVRVGPGLLKKPTAQNPLAGSRERTSPLSVDDRMLALTVKDSSVDRTSADRGDTVHRTVISPADPGSDNLKDTISNRGDTKHQTVMSPADPRSQTLKDTIFDRGDTMSHADPRSQTPGDSGKDTEGLKSPSGNEQPITSGEAGPPTEYRPLESATSPDGAAGNLDERKCGREIAVTHIQIGGAGGVRETPVGGRPSRKESLAGHGDGNAAGTRSHGLDLSPLSRPPCSSPGPDTVPLETHRYESEDLLDQLLKKTGLNVHTFSVHLTQPAHVGPDATRERSSHGEPAPLHPSSSSNPSSSSSRSSSSSSRSASPPPSRSSAAARESSANSSLPSSSSQTIPSSSSSYSSGDVLASSSSSSSDSVESSGPDDTSGEGGMGTDSEHGTKVNRTETLREGGPPPFRRPTSREGFLRRPRPNMGGATQNRTRGYLRPPQHPQRGGPIRQPFPYRRTNGTHSPRGVPTSQSGEERMNGPARRIQTSQSGEERRNGPARRIQTSQSGEKRLNGPAHRIQTSQSGEKGIHNLAERITSSQSGEDEFSDPSHRTSPSGKEAVPSPSLGMETNQSLEPTIGDTDVGTNRERVNRIDGVNVGQGNGNRGNQPGSSRPADPVSDPNAPLGRHPSTTAGGSALSPGSVLVRNGSGPGRGRVPAGDPLRSRGVGVKAVDAPGDAGEPLDGVRVQNLSSRGFDLVWSAPDGLYDNFVVTREQTGGEEEEGDPTGRKEEWEEGDAEKRVEGKETEGVKNNGNKQENKENVVPERDRLGSEGSEATEAAPGTGSADRTFVRVLPGPEPPSNLEFSQVAENSLSVSWTRPKSKVSGFKVTYTHTQDGEPVSVGVGSEDSTLALSQLSPGSSYEVSVISVLGLDESDPIKDFVMTLPDPPTNLRAVNVTDTKALLLWRPALAAVDKYAIVYGTGKGSDLRVTVSGNAAEQQLTGLEGSTRYTVTITSQLGAAESSPATTTFTTTGGSEEGPRDLKANQVTARSAVLSWKRPSLAVGSYKLTYQTEGQEMKEVTVDGSVTEHKLTRLVPSSKYTVQLQGERGGRYSAAVSTHFITGTLRFPFPTDCSQELLNGQQESGEVEIFPQGKGGPPLLVYCDMESDGGGWTVIQRRVNGKVDFFQGWKNYSRGFGNVSEEFWLGNENLHNLTKMAPMSLRVDLRAGEEAVFAKYSAFAVDVGKKNYKLTVSGYSGTAGNSMGYHNNRPFSTKDRDPMPFITRCAMSYRGGWWYRNCHEANLNGRYGTDVNHQGIIWTAWKGKDVSIPFTEMKIRPTAFNPTA